MAVLCCFVASLAPAAETSPEGPPPPVIIKAKRLLITGEPKPEELRPGEYEYAHCAVLQCGSEADAKALLPKMKELTQPSTVAFIARTNVWLVDTWNRGAVVNAAYAAAVAKKLYAPSDQEGMDIEADEAVVDLDSDTVRLSGESVGRMRSRRGEELRFQDAAIQFAPTGQASVVKATRIEVQDAVRPEVSPPAAAAQATDDEPELVTAVVNLEHAPSRHIKALVFRESELIRRHYVWGLAYKDGNKVVVEGEEAGVEAAKEAIARFDVPQPEPLPPDGVLREYLEAWMIPYDDEEGVTFPDFETMYSLTTKEGRREISLDEFREVVGSPRWRAPERPESREAKQRSIGMVGLFEILTVYEPDIREENRAYVDYTLRVRRYDLRGPIRWDEPPPGWAPSAWQAFIRYGGRSRSPTDWRARLRDDAHLERNTAFLVKEDGQWRLAMRFDAEEDMWHLPLWSSDADFPSPPERAGP